MHHKNPKYDLPSHVFMADSFQLQESCFRESFLGGIKFPLDYSLEMIEKQNNITKRNKFGTGKPCTLIQQMIMELLLCARH